MVDPYFKKFMDLENHNLTDPIDRERITKLIEVVGHMDNLLQEFIKQPQEKKYILNKRIEKEILIIIKNINSKL
jgi:hypothetical protein